MNIKKYYPVGILLGVVIAIQLLTLVFNVNFYLTQLTMSAYYVLVAVGLCMLAGYAGQISLGQAGFFAIGGYTSAYLTTVNLVAHKANPLVALLSKVGMLIADQDLYGNELLYISPWPAFIIALILTVIIAYLVGIPLLSLKGHYLAMATLGFGIIIYRVVLGSKMFGEADGISNVPEFMLLPGIAINGDFNQRILNYYIAWLIVVAGLIVLINLINSRVGRALRSLHGSEEAANAMGINTGLYRLNVFVIAALFASIGGVCLTHYNGGIGPGEASVIKSVRYVVIVAVGGMANLWGVLIMGVVLNFLSLRGVFGAYDDAVFGIILIVVMVFAPDGFLNIKIKGNIKSLVGKLRKNTE